MAPGKCSAEELDYNCEVASSCSHELCFELAVLTRSEAEQPGRQFIAMLVASNVSVLFLAALVN